MSSDNNVLNPLWLYCRDSTTEDFVDLDVLIDSNIENINYLAGRIDEFKVPPLIAILISNKTTTRKYKDVKHLLDRGANVNCLDESGQNSLGYMLKAYPWANEEQKKIIDLLESYGAILVRGQSTSFYFDLYLEGDDFVS
jgi:hypothetical protein